MPESIIGELKTPWEFGSQADKLSATRYNKNRITLTLKRFHLAHYPHLCFKSRRFTLPAPYSDRG